MADGAPAPSAAFLTVAPKVGALVALGRLALALPEDRVGWRLLVAVLAAATMTLGNLAALWQDDVRRLLGWSAVSQAGYGLMAVVALGRNDIAIASLLYFLAAYAAANLAAFAVVVVELRGRTDRQLRRARVMPAHPRLRARRRACAIGGGGASRGGTLARSARIRLRTGAHESASAAGRAD